MLTCITIALITEYSILKSSKKVESLVNRLSLFAELELIIKMVMLKNVCTAISLACPMIFNSIIKSLSVAYLGYSPLTAHCAVETLSNTPKPCGFRPEEMIIGVKYDRNLSIITRSALYQMLLTHNHKHTKGFLIGRLSQNFFTRRKITSASCLRFLNYKHCNTFCISKLSHYA